MISPGIRFGMLAVLFRNGSRSGKPNWVCRCDCGAETEVLANNLKSGATKSCGCNRTSGVRIHGITTGAHTGAYRSWKAMRQRCNDPNADNYEHYGARGIVVCDRWTCYQYFLDDMGERPEGMTIERNDVNGNYEPSNCRWATKSEQQMNKRHA